MKREDIDRFERLVGQLASMYEELAVLSKKSPTDAVNKFKLHLVKRTLGAARDFLVELNQPLDDFGQFNDEELPQNSDVIFVLAQFLQAFEKLRADNCEPAYGGIWHWRVEAGPDGSSDAIRTTKPKRLRD